MGAGGDAGHLPVKRIERRRVMRLQRIAVTVGLSFALGALVDTALTWRLHEFEFAEPDRDAAERQPAVRPANAPPAAAFTAAATTTSAPPARVPTVSRDVPIATDGIVTGGSDIEILQRRKLEMPVEGVMKSALHDSFTDSRALGRPHDAIDIMAPKGTPVVAVEDGTVAKLFTSVAGGLTLYQFDPAGEFSYYYAHLDSYAPGIREAQAVRRGQTIGYVGSTGNASASAPHLHFAISRLEAERRWWKGEPVNPYPVLR